MILKLISLKLHLAIINLNDNSRVKNISYKYIPIKYMCSKFLSNSVFI